MFHTVILESVVHTMLKESSYRHRAANNFSSLKGHTGMFDQVSVLVGQNSWMFIIIYLLFGKKICSGIMPDQSYDFVWRGTILSDIVQ